MPPMGFMPIPPIPILGCIPMLGMPIPGFMDMPVANWLVELVAKALV